MATGINKFNASVRGSYKAKSKFLDHIENLAINVELETAVPFNWEQEVRRTSESLIEIGKPRGEVCIALIRAIHQASYLNLVICMKLSELSKLIVYSLNADNYVGLGLGSRSLFEHAASIAYLFHESKKIEEGMALQHEEKRVVSLLDNFTKKLEKLYYGTRYFEQKTNPARPIHVNELMKRLGRDIKGVKNKYAYLCDFVHPNLGINLLISDGGLGCGTVEPEPELVKKLVGGIIELDGDMACYASDTNIDITAIFGLKLRRMCDDLLSSDASLNVILSGQSKNYFSGSGRSRNDPIQFSGVTTYAQYFGALERFLTEHSLNSDTRETKYGAGDDTQNFDVYRKDGKEFWILVNY